MTEQAARYVDAALRSARAVTGPRPHFMSDVNAELAIDMVMVLASELVVTRDRLDTVERLLEERSALDRGDIESPRINERDDVVDERLAANEALMARLLRMVHQNINDLSHKPDQSLQHAAE